MLGVLKSPTSIDFLHRAVASTRSHGVTAEQLMTDDGPA